MLTPGSRAARISRVRALVRRVGKAVQKADRDALDAERGEPVGQRIDRLLVERRHDPAARVDPLRHDKAQAARHQRRRQVDIDVVLLEAVLVPDLDRVAEPLGRDQRGPGALALDDRVGRQRRAVDDDRQIGRRRAPASRSTARIASMTARSGASGVVRILALNRRPLASSATSVKVPPISTPSLAA